MCVPDNCKLLIVSATVIRRQRLTELVGGVPGIELAGTAASGRIAISKLKQNEIDLVLLDAGIEDMSSRKAVRAVLDASPETGVVMLAARETGAAGDVVAALEAGAMDHIPCPVTPGDTRAEQDFRKELRGVVQALSTRRNLKETRRMTNVMTPISSASSRPQKPGPSAEASAPSRKALVKKIPDRFSVLAVGVSTGGPNALTEFVPKLPPDLGVPILLVQHMPQSFTRVLAESLDAKSPLPVREAVHGEPVEANTVYLAPGGQHMVVERKAAGNGMRPCIALNSAPPRNSCRPSVDVLFESVAEVYAGHILAVVMTGMGNDGRDGVARMKQDGCYCLSQSADTCVVYGMPRAVDEAGLSDERVPLSVLAARVAALVRKG